MDEEMFLALMEAAYGGWSPDQPYSHMNSVPEQLYDLYKPRSDTAANTMAQRMVGGPDAWGDFSNDVVLQADPTIQPYLVELLANNDKDMVASMAAFNDGDYQDQLRQRIGRTFWDDVGQNADWATRNRINSAPTGEARDDVAVDYVKGGIENALAQGSPSIARNAALQQFGIQSAGGRPYPQQPIPAYSGPGFSTGGGAASTGAEGVREMDLEGLAEGHAAQIEANPRVRSALQTLLQAQNRERARAEAMWNRNQTERGRDYAASRPWFTREMELIRRAAERGGARHGRRHSGESWTNKVGDWLNRNVPGRDFMKRDWVPWS